MTETAGDTTGTTTGMAADDNEELLEDERAPPPPVLLRRELMDAVDDAMAEERTEPKLEVLVAVANRLSSHSEIWKRSI